MPISVVPDTNDAQEWQAIMTALGRLLVEQAKTVRYLHRLGWKDSAIAERFNISEHEAHLIWHTKEIT